MIRKISLLGLALALAAVFAYAQDEKKSVKVTGYVVDNMCASMHGTEDEAKNHPNACALMPNCEKSGYAVVRAIAPGGIPQLLTRQVARTIRAGRRPSRQTTTAQLRPEQPKET